MLQVNRRTPTHRDEGFTLTELMVVVMIIAVLVAVAIPTYVSARSRAGDRAAQTTVRQSLVTAKTLFQADEDYSAATTTALARTEPSVRFVSASVASSGAGVASTDSPDASTFVVAVFSRTGTCFYLRDEAVGSTGGTTYARVDTTSPQCTAANVPPDGAFGPRW